MLTERRALAGHYHCFSSLVLRRLSKTKLGVDVVGLCNKQIVLHLWEASMPRASRKTSRLGRWSDHSRGLRPRLPLAVGKDALGGEIASDHRSGELLFIPNGRDLVSNAPRKSRGEGG